MSGIVSQGQLFDPHITGLLKSMLRPDDVFIDVGAHIGWFSVIGSKLAGRVIAVEPDPDNWRHLRANLRINGCNNAKAFQTAVGAIDGQARLYQSFEHRGDHQLSVVGDRSDYTNVQLRSIDSLLAEIDLRASWIKLDTQGSEVAILRGMRQTLEYHPHLVIEFWPYGLERCAASADELIELLGMIGGDVWLMNADNLAERVDLPKLTALAHSQVFNPASGGHADLVVVPPGASRTSDYLAALPKIGL